MPFRLYVLRAKTKLKCNHTPRKCPRSLTGMAAWYMGVRTDEELREKRRVSFAPKVIIIFLSVKMPNR